MEREALSLSGRAVEGGHLVTASGDIDMVTAPQVTEYLAQYANGDVHLDLSAVDFLDSSGLNTLVAAHRRVSQRGGRLVLHGASPLVLRVMSLTNLDHYLDLDGRAPPSNGSGHA